MLRSYSEWVFFLLGVSILLPQACFFNSVGYFSNLMPSFKVMFWVTFLLNFPIIFSQITLLFLWKNYSPGFLLILTLSFEILLMSAIPLTTYLLENSENLNWFFFCIYMCLYGVCTGSQQILTYQIVSNFPFTNVNSINNGCGIASFLFCLLGGFTLLVFSDENDKSSLVYGAFLFFSIAAIGNFVNLCLFLRLDLTEKPK